MAADTSRGVLLVEDESIVAHDLQQMLAELGYEACGIAASAEEAMARSLERRPDLALVDIRIRGKLDGIKTAQLLQERFGVPIVYLTAYADDATVERAARTRPYGYLIKPVKPGELKSTIEIALYKHAMDADGIRPPAAAARTEALASGPRDARAPDTDTVRRQLEHILQSPDFDASGRSRDLLRFIVEEALAGRGKDLTQGAIATRVFARKDDFDALLDPIVRIQAGRLRRSLERYYLLGGRQDPVRIDLPKGTYNPAFRQARPPAPEVRPAVEAAPPAEAPGWPSVVVAVLDRNSAGPEQEDLAVRLQEELLEELGRYRDVRVVGERDADRLPSARRTEARFELRGRLRREVEGWIITARLVDRTTGEQLWGDQYHARVRPDHGGEAPEDVARIIAARVGGEQGVVVQALVGEYRKRPAVATGTYGAILRSQHFFFARDLADLGPTLECLRRAVAEEPETPLAWAQLSRLCAANYAFELSALETPIDQAISDAYQAVRLDPASTRFRCVLASALLIKGELDAGRAELEQALRLNSGSLVYLEIVGWLLAVLGDWERGIELIHQATTRNPHHLPQVFVARWADHLRRGEFEKAYSAALEQRDPTFFWRALMRASALGHLGRIGEARAQLAELLAQKPDFAARGRVLIGHYMKFPDLQARIAEGLAKAGLELA